MFETVSVNKRSSSQSEIEAPVTIAFLMRIRRDIIFMSIISYIRQEHEL